MVWNKVTGGATIDKYVNGSYEGNQAVVDGDDVKLVMGDHNVSSPDGYMVHSTSFNGATGNPRIIGKNGNWFSDAKLEISNEDYSDWDVTANANLLGKTYENWGPDPGQTQNTGWVSDGGSKITYDNDQTSGTDASATIWYRLPYSYE